MMNRQAEPQHAFGSGTIEARYAIYMNENLRRVTNALEKLVEQNERRAKDEEATGREYVPGGLPERDSASQTDHAPSQAGGVPGLPAGKAEAD